MTSGRSDANPTNFSAIFFDVKIISLDVDNEIFTIVLNHQVFKVRALLFFFQKGISSSERPILLFARFSLFFPIFSEN